MYCGTGTLGRSTTPWWGGMRGGGKAPLVPHSQYIFCKYVIEDGQNPQPL